MAYSYHPAFFLPFLTIFFKTYPCFPFPSPLIPFLSELCLIAALKHFLLRSSVTFRLLILTFPFFILLDSQLHKLLSPSLLPFYPKTFMMNFSCPSPFFSYCTFLVCTFFPTWFLSVKNVQILVLGLLTPLSFHILFTCPASDSPQKTLGAIEIIIIIHNLSLPWRTLGKTHGYIFKI